MLTVPIVREAYGFESCRVCISGAGATAARSLARPTKPTMDDDLIGPFLCRDRFGLIGGVVGQDPEIAVEHDLQALDHDHSGDVSGVLHDHNSGEELAL